MPSPQQLAAIDIGSNTVHLSRVQVSSSGRLHKFDSHSEYIGLGQIVRENGRIPPAAARQVKAILQRLLRRAQTPQVLIAATEATREASNGRAVMRSLSRDLNRTIHILSGRVEGELTFNAVRPELQPSGRQLLVDLGGGSTEFTTIDGRRRLKTLSLPLGSSALLARIHNDPPGPLEWAALAPEIEKQLLRAPRYSPRRVIVVGGVATHLMRLVGRAEDPTLAVSQLDAAARRLLRHPSKHIARKEKMNTGRVRSLAPGVLILSAILGRYQVSKIHVSSASVREGIILAYLKRGNSWWKGMRG